MVRHCLNCKHLWECMDDIKTFRKRAAEYGIAQGTDETCKDWEAVE